MKKFLAFLMTTLLLASAPAAVLADELTIADPLVLDGFTQVEVTSADTSIPSDARNFFDSLAETKCMITFQENAEGKTFSVYTATRVPEALTKFASILEGEKGTILTINAFGTNDSLLMDWTPLVISIENLDTAYAIFDLPENTTAYAFYRFDFTLEFGSYFELAELALFKPTTDAPEMKYDLGEVVEAGEMPALIPVEEAAEEVVLTLTNDPFLAPVRKTTKAADEKTSIVGTASDDAVFLAPTSASTTKAADAKASIVGTASNDSAFLANVLGE